MQKNPAMPACTQEERRELLLIAENPTESSKVVQRARMILDALDGKSVQEITGQYHISPGVYTRWVDRYTEKGVSGLWDQPHTGRMPIYDTAFEKQVLELLRQEPPEGHKSWDGPTLAKALNASDDAVWRVLRKHHVTLARRRVWTVDLPMRNEAQERHLVGVYVAPPYRLIVLTDKKAPLHNGRIITKSHKLADAMSNLEPAAEGSVLLQAMDAASQLESKRLKTRQTSDAMEFLRDAALRRQEDATLYVIYTGDMTTGTIGTWRMGNPWMKFYRLEDIEQARGRVGHLLRSFPELLSIALSYPETAPCFRWVRSDSKK